MLNKRIDQEDSLVLHTDLYELNMMYTYFKEGISERNAVFELFFRKEPFGNGYAVNAGLSRVIDYLSNLHFSESDLKYLQEQEGYDDDFIDYLRNFELKLTVRSALEGELVFANEPILQVEGPLAQCQLVETALLNIINFQSLIATKAARIKVAVGDDSLMEFGTRRAQETDAAIWGTRAAYIGGFDATSNVRAGKLFGIPMSGTHAHALIQAYNDEYKAFKAYAQTHKNCVFLVDTYDTLRSGVPTAIRVAKEMGDKINFQGVRIDSGDMAYISKKVRKQLDDAGFTDAKIYASNDLDEKTIQNLKMQDTLKISSNAVKVSTPGKKQVWRISANEAKKNEGDWVSHYDEDPRDFDALFMFHPQYTYINKVVTNFTARPLLQTIFESGKLIYNEPSLQEIKEFTASNLDGLWDEYKRSLNPQDYPVDLSQKLYDHKMSLINNIRSKIVKRGY